MNSPTTQRPSRSELRPGSGRRRALPAAFLAVLLAAGCGGAPGVPQPEASLSETNEGHATSTPETAERGLNAGVVELDVEGVPVLWKPTPSNAILSIGFYFDGGVAGWDDETAGAESLALAAMTRGGPRSMTRGSWNATLDRVGASVTGSSGYDYSSLQLNCVAQTLDTVWPAFVEMFHDPALRESDIELQREQTLTSLRSEMDNPDSAVSRTARELFWEGHPYARRPEGSLQSVASFAEADLRASLDRLLQRARMRVVVVGNIERERLVALLTPLLAPLPEGEPPTLDVPAPTPRPAAVRIVPRPDLPTNYVIGFFPAPDPTHADYPAVRLALELLSDRLFEEVRTRRNLTYAVSAGLASRRANYGYLYVTATDPATTLEVMRATVDDLIANPIEAEVLRGTLAVWKTGYLMNQSLNQSQGGQLAAWELLGGGRHRADELLTALEDVTPDDVARALDTWLRGVQFAVVGDDSLDPALFEEGW